MPLCIIYSLILSISLIGVSAVFNIINKHWLSFTLSYIKILISTYRIMQSFDISYLNSLF